MGDLVLQERPLRLTARPRFGKFEFETREVRAGASIAGLASVFEDVMPPNFRETAVAILNDELPIPPRRWKDITPKEGDSLFFVNLPRKGGQTLQIIAAVAITAAMIAAYQIPFVGPFVSLAIGVGGSFLIAALAPKGGGNNAGKAPKQLGNSGYSGNTLAPYEQLPMVLGEKRVPLFFLAPPITILQNENAFGIQISGVAGRTQLSDFEIAGTPIEVLEEQTQEGEDADPDPTIYTQTLWQEPGLEFTRHAMQLDTANDERWLLEHSPDDDDVAKYDHPKFQFVRLGNIKLPREVIFDLRFDQGLFRTTGNEKAGCAFQLVLDKDGEERIYLPEIHCHGNIQTPIRAKIIVAFYEDNLASIPSTGKFWAARYANSSPQSSFGYPAYASYYGTGTSASHVNIKEVSDGGDDQTIVIFADPLEIPELFGERGLGWSIGIRMGSGYFDTRMNFSTNQYAFDGGGDLNGLWFHDRAPPGGGSGDATMEDQSKVVSHCVLEQVTRDYGEPPVIAGNFAYYECRTKNKRVDQITAIARRYVDHMWDRVSQSWRPTSTLSRNCGAILYDHCVNPNPLINAIPLNASKVNALEAGKFFEHCEDLGLECNAYITPGRNWWDIYKEICEAGLGRARTSQTYGVYLEKDRTADPPLQVFSPRNSRNFKVQREYEKKPHALRVTFDDKADAYQTNPGLLVPAPGYSIDGFTGTKASLYEARHYDFITSRWQAEYRGDIELKIIHYRNKVYSFETDMRWLRSPRGSLVAISQYTLDETHGWAAIRRVNYTDVAGTPMIAGLYLDMEVDLRPTTTGVVINTLGGELVAAQTSMTGRGKFIKFDTPIASDPDIDHGAHITIGAVGSEYIRVIVDDIIPLDRGSARMVCYDEAPEIWA